MTHGRPSAPPGLCSSDTESGTRGRERRRVALACRELGAELADQFGVRFEGLESKLDKISSLVQETNTLHTPPRMPGVQPPWLTWCYWAPILQKDCSEPESEASPARLNNVLSENFNSQFPTRVLKFDLAAGDSDCEHNDATIADDANVDHQHGAKIQHEGGAVATDPPSFDFLVNQVVDAACAQFFSDLQKTSAMLADMAGLNVHLPVAEESFGTDLFEIVHDDTLERNVSETLAVHRQRVGDILARMKEFSRSLCQTDRSVLKVSAQQAHHQWKSSLAMTP